jgi:hypothetical protein
VVVLVVLVNLLLLARGKLAVNGVFGNVDAP